FKGGLAGVFWIIVLLQNPSSLQLEVRNLPIYQSGKGYKAISKTLGLPQTTVRAIIYKWRKRGTVENLPRSGRPTKITPSSSDNSSRTSQKTPQQYPKNCRPHLPQLSQRQWGGPVASQKECNRYVVPYNFREEIEVPGTWIVGTHQVGSQGVPGVDLIVRSQGEETCTVVRLIGRGIVCG
ncbi:hypothetical protein QTP70_024510, partial [Hemibagrus guttatus]